MSFADEATVSFVTVTVQSFVVPSSAVTVYVTGDEKSRATPLAGLIVAYSETAIVGTSPLRFAVENETVLFTDAASLLITAACTS